MKRTFLAASLAVLGSAALCHAQSTFKGQFIYDGAPPVAKELGATPKEKADCGDPNLKVFDESLVVDPTTKGLANVIVYLSPATPTAKKPPVPADNAKLKAASVVFDNKLLRFQPHVLVVQVGQKLEVGNSDKIGHNTKIDFAPNGNPASNDSLAAGAKITKTFAKEDRLPATVSCTIHPYMKSFLLVRDNPYFAVSDKDGNFEIANIPDGEWQFTVWQEKSGYLTKVKVGDKETTWAKGKISQKFAGKPIDLGKVLVSTKNFEGK